MAQKSWFQVCKDAMQMYLDRDKYAYFYGAKGQKLTKDVMDYLWSAEPGHFKKYDAVDRAQIYRNSLNKIGLDCSGFVTRVTGETGYSIEIYNKRTVETSLTDGVAGQFLFTTWGGTGRHIGLDAPGYGFQLDMGWESTDANVAKKKDSVHLARIKDVAWEHSFQTAAVNYTGSYATDPNAKPEPKPEGKTGTVTNCTAVNLRQGPTTDCNVCTVNLDDGKGWRHVLYFGETAEVINVENGWYQVLLQGQGHVWTPWVKSTYLSLK